MEENKDNILYCSHCGAIISEDEDYETVDGDIVCTDCIEQHTTTCDRCGRIGVLPENKQKYAKQILEDIRNGVLIVEEGKTFLSYIQEYSNRSIKKAIEQFTSKFDLDFELFYDLYSTTIDGKIDNIKLEAIEKKANLEKAKQYFNTTSALSVKGKLHNELKNYIEEKKAEIIL